MDDSGSPPRIMPNGGYTSNLFQQQHQFAPNSAGPYLFPGIPFPPGGQISPANFTNITTQNHENATCTVSTTQEEQANNKRCSWSTTETKHLIQAYKEHYPVLNDTKSTHGKKIVWDNIMTDFVDTLRYEANIKTTKTLTQVKEKWRTLFDKYKLCADNNRSTGTDRKTFEFFEDIDEFMASSDKANPRNIQQTQVTRSNQPHEITEVNTALETNSTTLGTSAGDKRQAKASAVPAGKTKTKRAKINDTEEAILNLLTEQQEALKRSEEKDEKVLQALLKSQDDAQQRHQDFTLAVLGKLGDIFATKK